MEKETGCRLFLRGRAIAENTSKRPFRMYVDISGETKGAVRLAFDAISKLAISTLKTNEAKWLMMYDIALDNQDNDMYQRAGDMVRQWEPYSSGMKWLFARDFLSDWDASVAAGILIGPRGRGINEIQGDSSCTAKVSVDPEAPRPVILVYGNSLREVKECAARVDKRINWADGRVPKKKGAF